MNANSGWSVRELYNVLNSILRPYFAAPSGRLPGFEAPPSLHDLIGMLDMIAKGNWAGLNNTNPSRPASLQNLLISAVPDVPTNPA
jgi:hypothetical protein